MEKSQEVNLGQQMEPQLKLFKAMGVRNPEYWQCIRYIAPDDVEKNIWKKSDAIGVYCTECKERIKYDSTKNSHGVKRHMDRFHSDLLEKYNEKVSKTKRRSEEKKSNEKIASFFPKKARTDKKASPVNQKEFNRLVALWTGVSLRPFSIVEDRLLKEVITFATSMSGHLTLPSRNTNRKNLMEEADKMKEVIKEDISVNCSFFSSTSDMWSSRTMKAFMAVTIQFLTDEFIMRSYTLEVKPVLGKHTGDMIKSEMESSFSKWGLDASKLSMLLRDSGSNMVKACNDWGIRHFSCVAHSLHLVVGPFLVFKKGEKTTTQNDSTVEENIDDDGFSDEFNSDYASEDVILEVRNIVQDVRKFCSFVKNSTKCVEKLQSIQKELTDSELKIKLDVKTRWNSTLSMINRVLQLMQPINDFIAFYKSPQGKKEFKGNKTTMVDITPMKWAILQGLVYLLTSFARGTEILSGEKYPTFVSALPVLRFIKKCLGNESLFDYSQKKILTKRQKQFLDLYGEESFFNDVTKKLEVCRKLLYSEFCKRFNTLDACVMWSTLLDPRYNFKSAHWRNDNERERAKKLLVQEVKELAKDESIRQQDSTLDLSTPPSPSKSVDVPIENDDEFTFNFYRENEISVVDTSEDVKKWTRRRKTS